MNSPKIDARSYAVLVLAFLVITLSVHLVAQRDGVPHVTTAGDTVAATRAIADSTRAVADANRQIADSIRDLATAVKEVRGSLDKLAAGLSKETEAEPVSADAYVPAASLDTTEDPDAGVFEIRRK